MNATIYKNDYTKAFKKICIFCTYLHSENLPDYIIHYINALRQVGYETIIVSHSNILEKDLDKLARICCTIVLKENVGYDFFAWKYGMEIIEDRSELESLLLTNDSIIGPFKELSGIFSKMNDQYDFWGMTESYEHKYHIQSYFLHANKKVINSKNWIDFWNDLILYKDKLDIVKNYEIELTQTLKKSKKIKIGAWVNSLALTAKYPPNQYVNYPKTNHWHGLANPTVKHWKELITEFDFPFIKKNLFFDKEHYDLTYDRINFRYHVLPINWKNTISRKYGAANTRIIEDFLERIFDIDDNLQYSKADYKVLFIYDSLNSSAQIDYLSRLVQFYNKRNIETELVVKSTPALLNAFNARIQEITKVNIIAELSKREFEVLKYRLSQEYVGTLIIGNPSSGSLAQVFSYTNAPHILISNTPELIRDKIPADYNFELHNPLIVTPAAGEPGINFDPIDISSKQPGKPGVSKISELTFIGLSEFRQQRKQIVALIHALKAKGLTFSCRLLFNEDEYNDLIQLIKSEQGLLALLEQQLNCSIHCYKSLADWFKHNNRELVISYFNEDYLPDEYIQCYLHEKVMLLTDANNLHKAICDNSRDALYGFFNVEGMADTIQRLDEDEIYYTGILAEQQSFIGKYGGVTKLSNYEELLFKKVIDFSELKSKEPLITVIFHFHFYSFDEVSFVNYKKRLRAFYKSNVSYLFSITEDSYEIDLHVESLKRAFPGCLIKIVPNKGRDIGAKFLLFDYLIKLNRPFEYVVVLHDKKSLHLPFWEAKQWIDSLLKIIEPVNYKPILKIFNESRQVGIVGTGERIADLIVKWSDEDGIRRPVFEWNNDLLHTMMLKYNIDIDDYNFVGGTMFWIKGELLKKLNAEYSFLNQYKTLEEGNVMDNNGSTITHSWERLLCWLSTNNGYKISKLN